MLHFCSSQTSFANIFGCVNSSTRNRRHSASFSQIPGSPVSGLPRIHQLRQEEHEVTSNSRELAHEKEIHSAMQISQSYEDLSLIQSESPSDVKNNRMCPIHVTLPMVTSFLSNSPSPTRGYGFQSPTRRSFLRRSESPVLRPSPLGGAKRKLDDRDVEFSVSPRPKRVYSSYNSISDGRGLLTTTSNSLPGSLSSVGTPESLSSADSPGSGFAFRTVDSPSPTLQSGGQGEPMVVGKGGDHDMAESPS
ncbi:hypothetical protein ABEB36_011569 [Hypothenemus hampei]|uniref:Uncharacterized protein n=1 Tax=Hypothenemus hampei TaxID=57062 RepID=A0ABD1E960_HYPHA